MNSSFAWVLTELALGQKKYLARRGRCLRLLGRTPDGADKIQAKELLHNPAQSGQSLPVKVNSKLRVKSGHFSGAN